MRNALVVLARFFLLAAATHGVGCGQRQSREIVFILPEGRTGVFAITEDRKAGALVVRHDNAVSLRIPEGGELFVKDAAFLVEWHTEKAYHGEKKRIRVMNSPDDEIAENAIACWGLHSNAKTSFYFVGRQADYQRISSMNDDYLRKNFLR